jgi:uncharacterized protein involved in exopolysaccharide biosynthesis
MNEHLAELPRDRPTVREVSLLDIGSALIRRRRLIISLASIGLVVGAAAGLLSTRRYASTATFIPQGSDGGASGLALAASQFGLRLPASGGGAWGPPVYVELLQSRTLLESVALDTVVVAEEGGRRVQLMDLLRIEGATPAERADNAYRRLAGIIRAAEVKSIGAVTLTVSTPWPSVSEALANRLVRGVNDFILQTRKSQAAAERRFVEGQAADAERALRSAENELQSLLERNRVIAGSSSLTLERDRLQREVTRREQVYSSLLQSREEAKIREVRDTPVITILESPQRPVTGESRKTALKAIVAALAGGMIGVLIAILSLAVAGARSVRDADAREFFDQLDAVTPRFLRARQPAP